MIRCEMDKIDAIGFFDNIALEDTIMSEHIMFDTLAYAKTEWGQT